MLTFGEYGVCGILIASDNMPKLADALDILVDRSLHGITNVVGAGASALVEFEPTILSFDEVVNLLEDLYHLPGNQKKEPKSITLDLCFDGEDLDEVLSKSKMSVDQFAKAIFSTSFSVAHFGFAPGFAYLDGLPKALQIDRRPTPRLKVPAGSVAIGGPYFGIYNLETPGGWNIIGRTSARLFDLNQGMYLARGDEVRFSPSAAPSDSQPGSSNGTRENHFEPIKNSRAHSRLVAQKGRISYQDLGRNNTGHIGVGKSGAMDPYSHILANLALGNDPNATTLELALSRVSFELLTDTYIVVSGAQGEILIDNRIVRHNQVHGILAGQRLDIEMPHQGVYTYFATRGGFLAPHMLASTSTDSLSGIGPELPTIGATLFANPHRQPPFDSIVSSNDSVKIIKVIPGPNLSKFDPTTIDWFFASDFKISPDCARTGIRLSGLTNNPTSATPLGRSQPLIPGAIQIPPNGEPIVIGRDNPTTGGYPVIACISHFDLGALAQLRPGTRVSFQKITRSEAVAQNQLQHEMMKRKLIGRRPYDELILFNHNIRDNPSQ